MFLPKFTYSLLLLAHLTDLGCSDRTKDKMYQTIDASKACFRRLNATHQIGCTSDRSGSTGAIHYCHTQKDLDFILRNGTAPPYVPIIPTTLFTSANIDLLIKKRKKVAGLITYASPNSIPSHFSHENQCPNPLSSEIDSCGTRGQPIWNPQGTGLIYRDIPFPIFYIEDAANLNDVQKCFEKHNNHSFDTQRDRALCSLELSTFMFATTDTPTCIRRSNALTNLNPTKFCDPLGDQNVWASLFPLATHNWTQPAKFRYIFVVARLDATSMFEKTAGATSPVTGMVALLSTAQLLKQMLPGNDDDFIKRNVIFLLLNGESFDYIGSQRFLYEMANGNFPVKAADGSILPRIVPDDIDLVVEFSQLGNSPVFAHYLNKPDQFLIKLQNNTGGLKVEEVNTLPPASLHTFIKKRPFLPGVVLTDHKESYTNHYYNSIYDNATNLGYVYQNLTSNNDENTIQKHLARISEMVAKSLYEELTNRTPQNDFHADLQLIDELLHCYLQNVSCRVHQAVQNLKLPEQPVSLYVGVEIVNNFLTTFVGLTLGWVVGDDVGPSDAKCTNIVDNQRRNYAVKYFNFSQSLNNLNETRCFRTSMNFTEAVSPAFVIENYNWTSGEYSTWAESTWGDIRLRMFLKPSAAHENMTIAIGSIVFIFSSLFVYFIKSKSDVLFELSNSGRREDDVNEECVEPANC